MPVAKLGAALIGVIAFGGQAFASTFSAAVASGGSFPICGTLSTSPASGVFSTNTNGSGSSIVSADAGPGVLSGSSVSTSSGTASSTNTNSSCFRAQTVIDDVIISGPGPSATIRVAADINALVEIAAFNTTWGYAELYASLQIGEDTGSGVVYHPSSLFQYTPSGWGAPTSASVNTTITSLDATVSTSSTIAVRLILAGRTLATDNFSSGSSIASLDATNGMGFPTSGPVFTLPAGFTANSTDAAIVDNQFGQPLPVPSMSGTAMAVLTILLAVSGSRSHMRRRVR